MTPAALKDLFRLEVDDTVEDYLWSDAEVTDYMDDAQDLFTRKTGGIMDATSDLCTVPVHAGEVWGDLDHRILKVRRADLVSTPRELRIVNAGDPDVPLSNLPGPVQGMILGLDDTKFRWNAVPVNDDTVQLLLYRRPLKALTDLNGTLEIPAQHHRALLYWMKVRAYGKQDAETFNRGKAAEFEAKFAAYCEDVKTEKERRKSKTRAVKYGGIGGGPQTRDGYW